MKTLESIQLSTNDKIAIQQAAKSLRENFQIAEIRLFGSKALGKDDSESDIDLLILFSEEVSWNDKNKISDLLFDIQLKHNVVFSFIAASVGQWTSGNISVLPIHEKIEKESIAA